MNKGTISPIYKDHLTIMADYCSTMMRDNTSSEHIIQVKENKICP